MCACNISESPEFTQITELNDRPVADIFRCDIVNEDLYVNKTISDVFS